MSTSLTSDSLIYWGMARFLGLFFFTFLLHLLVLVLVSFFLFLSFSLFSLVTVMDN